MDRAPQGRSRWAVVLTAALAAVGTEAYGFAENPTPMRAGFLIVIALTTGLAVLFSMDGFKKSDTVRLIPTASKKSLKSQLISAVRDA